MNPVSTRRRVIWSLALLSLAYFLVFIPPNLAASGDLDMVRAFEPDEAVPLPYVFDMIKPAETLKQVLINFAFYDYYFYGYPHFAVSAALLVPLAVAGDLESMRLVMLILRQMVSVLPMLLAILCVVFLQTGFTSWKAVPLFLFLAFLPGLVSNNYWWHPDSLAILFAMLALLFLARDGLRLGRNFYLAAAMCAISASTKGIGFYFAPAVALYLFLTWRKYHPSFTRLALSALGFLAVMAAVYLLSNPILIYASVRSRYFGVMRAQSALLSEGYEVRYAAGILSWLPLYIQAYGHPALTALAFAACLWGALRGPRRLLHALILAWALPFTVLLMFFIHFKTQYWLPAALPLFSSLVLLVPERLPSLNEWQTTLGKTGRLAALSRFILLLAVAIQAAGFGFTFLQRYREETTREQNSPSIAFYTSSQTALAALPRDRGYHVYHDVNMYVPARPGWNLEERFEMLDYAYIQEKGFDIMYISQQRIYDYLNPEVQAIDADQLERAREFYRDAEQGSLHGYRLLMRDGFGLLFVSEAQSIHSDASLFHPLTILYPRRNRNAQAA